MFVGVVSSQLLMSSLYPSMKASMSLSTCGDSDDDADVSRLACDPVDDVSDELGRVEYEEVASLRCTTSGCR